jgi:hypothetical protein
MARPKSDAVEIEKLRVGLEKLKILEREKTWRLGILSFFGTIAIGIIAWSTVRMTDKPSWLVFALAILAALGGPSVVMFRAEARLKREIKLRGQRIMAGVRAEDTELAVEVASSPEDGSDES